MKKEEIEKLAQEHWDWIEGLWESMPDDMVFGVSTTEYLYKTAFVHGFKHASNQSLHQTPKVELKCTCHPHDLAYYGCRCR